MPTSRLIRMHQRPVVGSVFDLLASGAALTPAQRAIVDASIRVELLRAELRVAMQELREVRERVLGESA